MAIDEKILWQKKSMQLEPDIFTARELLKGITNYTDNQLEELMIETVLKNLELGGMVVPPNEDQKHIKLVELKRMFGLPISPFTPKRIREGISNNGTHGRVSVSTKQMKPSAAINPS